MTFHASHTHPKKSAFYGDEIVTAKHVTRTPFRFSSNLEEMFSNRIYVSESWRIRQQKRDQLTTKRERKNDGINETNQTKLKKRNEQLLPREPRILTLSVCRRKSVTSCMKCGCQYKSSRWAATVYDCYFFCCSLLCGNGDDNLVNAMNRVNDDDRAVL